MNFCECCKIISEAEKWCFEFDIKANELGKAFMFQLKEHFETVPSF